MAASADELAYAVAAANASQTNTIAIVASSGSDGGAVLAQLAPFAPDTIRLVGRPASFSPSLLQSLAGAYTVDDDLVASTPTGWTLAATEPSRRERVVVGNTTIAGSVEIATTLAVATGAALLVLDGTDGGTEVSAILDDTANTQVTIVGEGALTAADALGESAVNRVVNIPISDLNGAERNVAAQIIGAGASVRKIVAAPSRSTASLASAARIAREFGAVPMSQASAVTYAGLLAQPITDVSSTGVGATETLAAAVEDAQRVFPALPAWRVTDTATGADDFSISYTAVPGAATYTAYDGYGEPVASSNTTTLVVPGVASAVAIVAESSSFDYLGTLQYKVNEYRTEADRPTAVIASTSQASNNSIVFLGAAGLPRLVTRTAIPITGEMPDPDNTTTEVAITCAPTFTDDVLDPTLQHQYNLVTLSQSPTACGQPGSAGDAVVRDVGGVTFPATEYPMLGAERANGIAASTPDVDRAASRSLVQQAIAARANDTAIGDSGRAFAPGDDWAPIRFRYQAFIPETILWAPGSTGSLGRPWQYFGGDGRSLDPNGSYRYRQDATVYFGSAHNISYTEWMGTSHKYACRWPNGTDCVHQQTATASTSELTLRAPSHTNTSAKFAFTNAASNPLHAAAPAINADIGFHLNPGGTTIRGSHDSMPRHEIWFTVEGWNEWYHAYSSTFYTAACLLDVAPACTTRFNVGI
nr:DUF3238 domain-containing protein [Cellulomonas humilata]